MSWAGYLNLFVLQFFFIRLTRHKATPVTRDIAVSIQYWVVPFTGWLSPFKFVGNKNRPRFKYIWERKIGR